MVPRTTTADTDIYARYSNDQGLSWSAERKVNDDATNNSQFLPQIAVDQTTGNVALAWYDARNDPNNIYVELFAAVSRDGGDTWSTNALLSGGTSSSFAAQNPIDFGDYHAMDTSRGSFYPIWADNSDMVDPPSMNWPGFEVVTITFLFDRLSLTNPTSAPAHNNAALSIDPLLIVVNEMRQCEDGSAVTQPMALALVQQPTLQETTSPRPEERGLGNQSFERRSRQGAVQPADNRWTEGARAYDALLGRAWLALEML